jgi:hypothetical protein
MNIPASETKEKKYLRIFFDELPDNKLRCEEFKSKIFGIQSLNQFVRSKISIRREDIVDVESRDHVILQCMDIILGSMAFRLNNMHLIKPEGSRTRGKRTISKEKLYRHILISVLIQAETMNAGGTMLTGIGNLFLKNIK